ncbi:alpha/beta fold hydrolase [Mucilaginibacter angelicae]|uniref:Alpha/beta fold hydrolase n=1 Tax=Mucilaginibacter angelicae TaxID=869718 RepID=A0ABV6LD19_9SPHI
MKTTNRILKIVVILIAFTFNSYTSFSRNVTGHAAVNKAAEPALPPNGFSNQYAIVNGVKLHYVIGGHGTPLMLVHGFPQNWYMWNRLLPELSKHFTVIAPDLRGVGESGKPKGCYDKKTMAVDLHELAKKLGYKKIDIAGHDIGMMVAYAYAAQFPNEVNKLALLDALIPGLEPVWSQVKAQAWWFGFFTQPHSAEVAEGRMNLILEDFFPAVSFVKNSFTPQEKAEFTRAYSVKGAATASFLWFVFEQDIKDNQEFRKNKLAMPVLAMGSDHFAPFLGAHVRLVASNVKDCIIKGSGHWILQEQTAQVQKNLLDFFMGK